MNTKKLKMLKVVTRDFESLYSRRKILYEIGSIVDCPNMFVYWPGDMLGEWEGERKLIEVECAPFMRPVICSLEFNGQCYVDAFPLQFREAAFCQYFWFTDSLTVLREVEWGDPVTAPSRNADCLKEAIREGMPESEAIDSFLNGRIQDRLIHFLFQKGRK